MYIGDYHGCGDDHAKFCERTPSVSKVGHYSGEVVYIYAFDVAYEMTRQPVRELLGQPVAQFVVDASKRSPRQLFFYRPANGPPAAAGTDRAAWDRCAWSG